MGLSLSIVEPRKDTMQPQARSLGPQEDAPLCTIVQGGAPLPLFRGCYGLLGPFPAICGPDFRRWPGLPE